MMFTKACPHCGARSFRFTVLSAFSDVPQECSACGLPALQKTPRRLFLPLFVMVPFLPYIISSRARLYTGLEWVESAAILLSAFVAISSFVVYRAISKLEKPTSANI
jgi:uncharacterized protein (DUF983 family)